MARDRESIKVFNAALDDDPATGKIILRGSLRPDSLHLLQTDTYQREVLQLSHILGLERAYDRGPLPDITLGTRGGDYMERENIFYLKNDTFLIDGLQRQQALLKRFHDGKHTKTGCIVYFNTDFKFEREMFIALNKLGVKLSPNVLINGARNDFEIVEALHEMTSTGSSVLYERVCWKQRMDRRHLISSLTFMKVVATLHSRFGSGRSTGYEAIASGLQQMTDKISIMTIIGNAKTFFSLLDDCWGIRVVAFKECATHMREGFLRTLADLFARHKDFWSKDEKKLFIDKELQRKIALFPLSDHHVKNLAAATGKARCSLYQMLLDFINSGVPEEVVANNRDDGRLSVDVLPDGAIGSAWVSGTQGCRFKPCSGNQHTK